MLKLGRNLRSSGTQLIHPTYKVYTFQITLKKKQFYFHKVFNFISRSSKTSREIFNMAFFAPS